MKMAPIKLVSAAGREITYQAASLDIWDKKYRLKAKDGTPVDGNLDDTYKRVATALAAVEENAEKREYWYGEFLWALRHGAIPAGRIISNAGAQEYKPATSTINCTVSGTIQDSMDDILAKVHEAGLTLKAGCGIGYEFSTLRPRGGYVSGAGAYTSGPLSFMDIYDKMCFTISSAGGRRGAQMATFDISHPDVTDFIRAKREDGRLRQFNLSLLVTDEFMQAVKNDGYWQVHFPIAKTEHRTDPIDLNDAAKVIWRDWPTSEGYIVNGQGEVACRIFKTIKARRLWDAIMSSTYDFAEPGFILIDRVNEMNNNWFCETIRATNPCVTGDTWVHTAHGPRQVSELTGKAFTARINGQDYASGAAGFFPTGTRPVLRIQTHEGHSLRLTHDHLVRRIVRFEGMTTLADWCPAGELRPGDQLMLHNHSEAAHWAGPWSEVDGYYVGSLLSSAQRSVHQVAANRHFVGSAQRAMQVRLHGMIAQQAGAEALWEPQHRSELLRALEVDPAQPSITLPIEQTSSEFYRGLLKALFDADGRLDVETSAARQRGTLTLTSQAADRLRVLQRMLLRLGITSHLRHASEPLTGSAPVAERTEPYRDGCLQISTAGLRQFATQVGFGNVQKAARLQAVLDSESDQEQQGRYAARVMLCTAEGQEPVYDVQIPGVNAFDANGFYVHNCGEQPLPPYGSCLLGSINLTKFVRNPFTEQATFDWDEFRHVVRVFTRMLDNVVEINGLPLGRQREEILHKRRHGMGYLGLGSTITMLRMKYGEEESLTFTEKVSCELALAGWEVALELAREKGPAPILEREFTVTPMLLRHRPEMVADGYKVGDTVSGKVLHARYSRYMQRVASVAPELVEELATVGARFTHHSSIAPTGTISLSLANNASNGIEPSFAHHYARNIIREGRKTKEKVDVYSFELLAYRELVNPGAMPYSEQPEEQLPDYFVTAETVTPKQHVDIQAAAQRWVDSSISKTANVPTDYPYEEFKDIYLYAYEQGLKGCTTFRFNPEAFQGVLVKDQDLANTTYRFTLEDGMVIELQGNEEIEYDGEIHTAANLFDALKEGYYGKF